MINSLVSMRQILISHLKKSSCLKLSDYYGLINLWIESLIEFGFSAQEIKIQLNIIHSAFNENETIQTSIKFFLLNSKRLND